MLSPLMNCPDPVPTPLPTVSTTPAMLPYSGVTGRCFKMRVCISGGSNPANDASRWRKDDPLEAKASTTDCLVNAVSGGGAALELPAPAPSSSFSKRRFMNSVTVACLPPPAAPATALLDAAGSRAGPALRFFG